MKQISKTVWILSWVSLFTDLASEMLYPVMPIYLKSIGFSVLLIGIIEGFIEALSGLSKAYFGHLSDTKGERILFVRLGYFLSAISKPLLAMLSTPIWVLFSRSLDRLGKGIRSAPRDALLRAETAQNNKGRVFGLHRSMDTVGAMLGPLVALLFLWQFPKHYTGLFLLAFIPGLLAVVLTLVVKEKKAAINTISFSYKKLFQYRKSSTWKYKRITFFLLCFALFNSSDVFLLLKLKEAGISDSLLIVLYIFYNSLYALLAYPLGKLADKIGMKPLIVLGFVLFSIAYTGIALGHGLILGFVFIGLYGVYAAATDGVAKAWIGQNIADAEAGIAYGSFMAFQSIVLMLASFITAGLWVFISPEVALLFSAVGSLAIAFLLYFFPYRMETQ